MLAAELISPRGVLSHENRPEMPCDSVRFADSIPRHQDVAIARRHGQSVDDGVAEPLKPLREYLAAFRYGVSQVQPRFHVVLFLSSTSETGSAQIRVCS